MLKSSLNAFSLTQARRDIPQGSFGYIGLNWCEECKGFDDDLGWHVTHRQTWEQPEEGYNYCPECGNEASENDLDHGCKVTGRRLVRFRRCH